MRAERAYCVLRISFCVVLGARWLLVVHSPPGVLAAVYLALTLTMPVITIAFSLVVLARRPSSGVLRWLVVSVVLDALCCFTNLSATAMTPIDARIPILHRADHYAWFVVIVAGGLRVLPSVAAVGGLLNTALALFLVSIEHSLPGAMTYSPLHMPRFLMAIYLLSTTALATAIAVRTKTIVRRSIIRERERRLAQREREREHRLVSDLLAVHHDINKHVGNLQRGIESLAASEKRTGQQVVSCIRGVQSLRQLGERVRRITRARQQVTLPRERIDLSRLVRELVEETPLPVEVSLRIDQASPLPCVLANEEDLRRLLLNLLTNAAEGQGYGQAATMVSIGLETRSTYAELVVEDDGPGLPGDRRLGTQGFTTKAAGCGYGMVNVRETAKSLGGTVKWERRVDGVGTIARVTLPLVPRSEPRQSYPRHESPK